MHVASKHLQHLICETFKNVSGNFCLFSYVFSGALMFSVNLRWNFASVCLCTFRAQWEKLDIKTLKVNAWFVIFDPHHQTH